MSCNPLYIIDKVVIILELLICEGRIVPMTDDFEVAGFKSKDLMRIQAIALYEGVNANDAEFERAEIVKSESTFANKPLWINPFNNKPTGHGLDRETGKWDDNRRSIGHIVKVTGRENAEKDGRYEVVVDAVVYEKYYPEISNTLRKLHMENDLRFSLEAEREQEIAEDGRRIMKNINFLGLCVVKNPAFEDASSLMVAELLNNIEKGGKNMDFEKMYNDLKVQYDTLNGTVGTLTEAKETAEKEAKRLEGELTTAREEALTAKGELATVTAERDTYKVAEDKAKKEALGAERLTKLQKYGEVSKSAEELAEMDKDAFLDVLSEMIDNFKPEVSENKDEDGKDILGVPRNKNKRDARGNKEKLLSFVEGLMK